MNTAKKELIGYGSELFDNFEIYKDESSIIYTADIDMDGEPDYKQTIDVDKDGKKPFQYHITKILKMIIY